MTIERTTSTNEAIAAITFKTTVVGLPISEHIDYCRAEWNEEWCCQLRGHESPFHRSTQGTGWQYIEKADAALWLVYINDDLPIAWEIAGGLDTEEPS